MNIQNSLKSLLKTGLTQSAIAKELGCTQAHVSDMVNGKAAVKRPTLKIVAGIERLLSAQKAAAKTDLPPPEIPPNLQNASVMLKGLGKFADDDAIAWFWQLPQKPREEIFENHDSITSSLCIEELNRIKTASKGDRQR